MHQYSVGLDVHSKQRTFVIADGTGTVVAEGEVPTTPAGLKEWCARQASPSGTPVALETGTTAFFVARQLSTVGMAPVVVDAHEVRLKAHRPTQKSDRRDARELCEGLRRGAGEQIQALEALLAAHQRPFAADLQRLQTIPGVGPIVAATGVAVFADVQRFPDAKHAASYAGLTPSTYQSGLRDVHGRITKRGSAELRAMLCEAAHHAARPQHPLHPYFAQQCAKHGYKRAVVAVAHRLCRIMFAMRRHGRDFDVSKLGIDVGPFEHTSVKLYRLKLVPRRPGLRPVATPAA